MRALLSVAPGGPDSLVLTELPDPEPGPGEVRIRVAACGVNFPDTLIIADRYQLKPPRPFAPGGEIAGTIDAVGEGVTGIAPGDRVIGWTGFGGMAEKVVLGVDRIVPVPAAMDLVEAACFLMTYGTSQHALHDRAGLRAGETLLVLGAAGGVGLAAVELGAAAGARVVAACSSEEKAAVALAHGASHAVVYPRGPFDADGSRALARAFKDAVGEKGADVIYDPIGGDYTEAALRAIAWEGRHLVVGFPAGIPRLPLNLTLLKSCQVLGVFWGAFVAREPKRHAANVAELMALHAAGKLRPEISARYPLARAGEALAALDARQSIGKLVVVME